MSVPEWEFPVDYNIDEVISLRAKEWAESRKIKNETIGEDRAQQELAFRDYLVSEKSEKKGKSEKFFWVTINPKPGVELPTIIRSVSKMYKKKWIDCYAYVYENTEKGHIHSHGLIKCKYESARARKELCNSVKDICDVHNVHCFKFVILDKEKAYQKMVYMCGQKKSEKMANVKLTEEWREKEMIKPIYTSDELPILLVRPEEETLLESNDNEPYL